jgi:hypothetical protein
VYESDVSRKEREYVKFGFTYAGDQDYPKPQCLICGDVFMNSSLKPSLLRPYLEISHSTQINKRVDFFKQKMIESKSDITIVIYALTNNNENALEASYRVSYEV